MKKLIIVTDAWYPFICGVTTVYGRLVGVLERHGVRVVVIHPELFGRTFPFPLYPELPMVLMPGRKIREIFEKERPDYVHIATEWSVGMGARRYCLKNKIPFTTSYHTNFSLYAAAYFNWGTLAPKMASSIALSFMRWFHGKANATMVSNETLKKQLENSGFKNVVIWPFGIDTEFFVRNEARAPEDARALKKPIFVYFSRIAKEKNTEEFLKLSLPGTKLLIGDGPERKDLEVRYDNKNTVFVGYKTGQDLVNWLSACDVCIFPSRTETFGLVVLEALSCGVPVVAHDVLGPKDVITDGVDGYLSENLQEAAIKCLNLSREKCRQKALQYSWEKSAEIFEHHMAL